MATFKDLHPDLQMLALEVKILTDQHDRFVAGDGASTPLPFASGALFLITLERFLRLILGPVEATQADTLPNLLQKAMSDRLRAFEAPGGDREYVTAFVTNLRNGLLHGNFEQLATGKKCATVAAYFNDGHFAGDLGIAFRILNTIMRQIDPVTGQRYDTPSTRGAWRTLLVNVLRNRINVLAQRVSRRDRPDKG